MNKLIIYSVLVFSFCLLGTMAFGQQLVSVVQNGHSAAVTATAFSNDGSLVATASKDKTAKLWERKGGLELRTFYGHSSGLNEIVFSPSDNYLATSSYDNSAKIWNIRTGELLFSKTNSRYNTAIAFSPDERLFALGGTYDEVLIWQWEKDKIVKKINVSPDRGLSYGVNLVFSPDGKYLFIGEDNQKARIFETERWEEVHTFPIEAGYCGGCVAFGSFGKGDSFFKMGRSQVDKYDLSSGKQLKSIKFDRKSDIQSFKHFEKNSFVISSDKEVDIIDLENEDTLFSVLAGESEFNRASTSTIRQEIVISTNDNKAVIYSLDGEEVLMKLEGILNFKDKGGLLYDPNNYWSQHIAKYVSLKNPLFIDKKEKEIWKAKLGSSIRSFKINSGQPSVNLSKHSKAVLSLDYSKETNTLLSGDGSGEVFLWDIKKKDTIRSFGRLQSPVFETRFSHNGKLAVASTWGGYIMVWDLETGEKQSQLYFENYAAYTVSFTPNDLYIISAGLNNELSMYEIDTGEKVRTFTGHSAPIQQLSFNSKGNMLSCSWDGSVRLWDISTGLMIDKYKSDLPVYASIFSNDESQVLLAGEDRKIKFYDISTKNIVKELKGHRSAIVQLKLISDGKRLISLDREGTLKLWDLEEEKEIYEHIQINKDEWMIRSPEGYFTGTGKAMELVHFVDGIKSYTAGQFFKKYYRPELMEELFGNNYKRERKGFQESLNSSPPPKVYLEASASKDKSKAYVLVKSINEGGGIHDLELFQNKKRLSTIDKRVLFENNDTLVYQLEVPLLSGENIIEALAYSSSGIASKKEGIRLKGPAGEANVKCHVLVVGINEYKNKQLQLNYARPDAEAMVDILGNTSQMPFSEVKIHTILDKKADKKSILAKMDELAEEVALQDVFIFYYAGHGSMVDDQFYFIPTEMARLFDKSSLESKAISADEVQNKLQNIQALKQLVIMDACQSGASVDVLSRRGLLREKAMAQLSMSSGVHILAAAGSEQYATEYEQLGHGLFTYFLIEGLGGKADGSPKDGKVTVYELKSYLDDQVPAFSQQNSGTAQYPYTFSKGNDFPILIIGSEADQ